MDDVQRVGRLPNNALREESAAVAIWTLALLAIAGAEGVAGVAPSLIAASSVPARPVVLDATSDVCCAPPAVVPVVGPVGPGAVPGVDPVEGGK